MNKKRIIIGVVAFILVLIFGLLVYKFLNRKTYHTYTKVVKKAENVAFDTKVINDYLMTFNNENLVLYDKDLNEVKDDNFKNVKSFKDYNKNIILFTMKDGKEGFYHIKKKEFFIPDEGFIILSLTNDGMVLNTKYGNLFLDKNLDEIKMLQLTVLPTKIGHNYYFMSADGFINDKLEVISQGHPQKEVKEGILLLEDKDGNQEIYNKTQGKVSSKFLSYLENPLKKDEYFLIGKDSCKLLDKDFKEKKCPIDITYIDNTMFQKMNPGIREVHSNQKYIFLYNFENRKRELYDVKTQKVIPQTDEITMYAPLTNAKDLDVYYIYGTPSKAYLFNVSKDKKISFDLKEDEMVVEIAKTKKHYYLYVGYLEEAKVVTKVYNMKGKLINTIDGMVSPFKDELELYYNVYFVNKLKYVKNGKLISDNVYSSFQEQNSTYLYDGKELGKLSKWNNKLKLITGNMQSYDQDGIYMLDEDNYYFTDYNLKKLNSYKLTKEESVPETIKGRHGNLFVNNEYNNTHKIVNNKGKVIFDGKGLISDYYIIDDELILKIADGDKYILEKLA